LLDWDRRLELWVVTHRVGFLDPFFQGLTYAGEYALVWIALAAVVAGVRRLPSVLVGTVLAAALAQGLSGVLKPTIGRDRPHVDALVALPHTHSFPSGHALGSFACATVIGAAVPRARPWLLLLAALVAWSRVYVGVHYPLDVFVGAVLGVALGLAVVRALRMLAAARRRSRPARRGG
jgi:undecaprenyl-diphosphatase